MAERADSTCRENQGLVVPECELMHAAPRQFRRALGLKLRELRIRHGREQEHKEPGEYAEERQGEADPERDVEAATDLHMCWLTISSTAAKREERERLTMSPLQ
jgi:hypothetical protein